MAVCRLMVLPCGLPPTLLPFSLVPAYRATRYTPIVRSCVVTDSHTQPALSPAAYPPAFLLPSRLIYQATVC